MLRDLSAQSDESALTTSSSSANDISGLCYTTTRIITMNVERTYRWTRMLQSRVQFSLTAALPPTVFLADCIINIVESEFSIGTAPFFGGPVDPRGGTANSSRQDLRRGYRSSRTRATCIGDLQITANANTYHM